MEIGKRIKLILTERGMTMARFAQRLKISPAQLSHVINGRRSLSTVLLVKIARELGVTPAAFYEEAASSGTPVMRRVPVLTVSAAAGLGGAPRKDLPQNVIERHIYADMPDERVFAIVAADDSMEPLYIRGDIIICSAERELRAGCKAVVNLAGQGVLCRVYRPREKDILLAAVNTKHEPLYVAEKDIRWIYPVVQMIRQESL